MKTDFYNKTGEKAGSVELPDAIFARKWAPQLVHQALLAQVANSRNVIAHTKGISEVRGGGRKIYAQKHTGNARHASNRAPIFKGGGVAHGPTKDRNYSLKINQKMKQAAIFSVLSKKLSVGQVQIIDTLNMTNPKTKEVFSFLNGFVSKVSGTDIKKVKMSALLIPSADNRALYRATRNIEKAKSLDPRSLNVYDLMKYKNVIIDRDAISTIGKTYGTKQKEQAVGNNKAK